jgi:hypothetical protein
MNPQIPPFFTINRAYYIIEAMDLVERAGRGETPWSRTDPEARVDTGCGPLPMGTRNLRLALTAVAALVIFGVFIVAGGIA